MKVWRNFDPRVEDAVSEGHDGLAVNALRARPGLFPSCPRPSVIRFIEDNWRLGNIDAPNGMTNGQGAFDRYAGTLMSLCNFDARPSTQPVLLNCNGTFVGQHASPPAICP